VVDLSVSMTPCLSMRCFVWVVWVTEKTFCLWGFRAPDIAEHSLSNRVLASGHPWHLPVADHSITQQ
jgi:hypothetical protein